MQTTYQKMNFKKHISCCPKNSYEGWLLEWQTMDHRDDEKCGDLDNFMEIINHSILLDILHVKLVWSIFEKTKYYTFSIPKFFMNHWFPHLKGKYFVQMVWWLVWNHMDCF